MKLSEFSFLFVDVVKGFEAHRNAERIQNKERKVEENGEMRMKTTRKVACNSVGTCMAYNTFFSWIFSILYFELHTSRVLNSSD